ncbi:hypothetical protein GCM10009099_30490 [Caenispirillum bisanense]
MGAGGQAGGRGRRSVFRYVVLRATVIFLLVVLLGGVSVLAFYSQMRDEQEFSTSQLPILNAAARLSRNAATLSSLSSRQLAAGTQSELATLADRIEDRSRMMSADLDRMRDLGLADGRLERLRAGHAALVDNARQLDALLRQTLTLGRQQGGATAELTTLLQRRALLLQRQDVVASELATLLSGLTHEAERLVEASRERAAERARGMVAMLVVVTVASAVLLIGLYHGLRRRLLDRLQVLTDALEDWKAGGQPRILANGPADELAALAGALSELVETVDRRTDELITQAITDPLTSLYNRRGFQERAAAAVILADRYDTVLTVLAGDIDHFKRINDTHGHGVGDLVLRRVAHLWHGMLREVDISGRLGGEEFSAVLPHTAEQAALVVAERIRCAIAALEVEVGDGRRIRCTISIGVAQRAPGEGIDALLARADAALYQAKTLGRNRVVCDQPSRAA